MDGPHWPPLAPTGPHTNVADAALSSRSALCFSLFTLAHMQTQSSHHSLTCSGLVGSSLRCTAADSQQPPRVRIDRDIGFLLMCLLFWRTNAHPTSPPTRGLALFMPVAVKNSTFFINTINVQQYKYRRVCVCCVVVCCPGCQ